MARLQHYSEFQVFMAWIGRETVDADIANRELRTHPDLEWSQGSAQTLSEIKKTVETAQAGLEQARDHNQKKGIPLA